MTALTSHRAAIRRRSSMAKESFASEAQLCMTFAAAMRAASWDVYPETAGFDLLLARTDTGEQLGVQAKLLLNNKVCEQILGGVDASSQPEYRAVLVPAITQHNRVLATMLESMNIIVLAPTVKACSRQYEVRTHWVFEDTAPGVKREWPRFHADAARRLRLPRFSAADRERMNAGASSPLQLTRWKEGVLMLLARLHVRGFVFAADVIQCGLDTRSFCGGFLKPCPISLSRGGNNAARWVLDEAGGLPRYDQQFPHTFAELVAATPSRAGHARALPPAPKPQPLPTFVSVSDIQTIDAKKGMLMKNKIDDLRNHLFATLEQLSDAENPMALDRARTIADVAQTIINSAKVEVDAMVATRKITSSKFLQLPDAEPKKEGLTEIRN